MTRIFDEKCEGAGYEEAGWSEAGTGTIDEDETTVSAGSPSGWGSQCIKIDVGDDVWCFTGNDLGGAQAISYWRFEIVLGTAIGGGEDAPIVRVYNNAESAIPFEIRVADPAGDDKFILNSYHDGNANSYTGFPTLSTNTRYRVEVKWDATNDKWAWKIDGVAQPNDQDGTAPVESEGNLTATHPTDCDIFQMGIVVALHATTNYWDLIAIDDADWVGAEVTGRTTYNTDAFPLGQNVGISLRM